MKDSKTNRLPGWLNWRFLFYVTLLLSAIGLSLFALISLQPTEIDNSVLRVGNVAPIDILAPISTQYESDVLTEQQRESAAQAVLPVYTTPDTQVARQQVDLLRATLTYITATRADTFASDQQKIADLALLPNSPSQITAQAILAVDDASWNSIQQESILVLQQVMRSTIREGQLADAQRTIPSLITLSLPDDQAAVVAELVGVFLAPNSFYSEELTEVQQQLALEGVSPVNRSFMQGETVVRLGKVLNSADIEALENLGLLENEDLLRVWLNAGIMTAITLSLSILFLYHQSNIIQNWKEILFTTSTFFIFLITARLVVNGQNVVAYMFPLAGFGLLISSLFNSSIGLLLAIPLSLMATYRLPNALEITFFYMLGSMFGVLILGRAQRLVSFIWAGFAVASIGALSILTFRLLDPFTDLNSLLSLTGASVVSGFGSTAITIIFQFFAAQILGLVTPLRLLELSRPDRPLLRYLLINAPGSYQHSLQVANLAEQAAEIIGADALLTRIGALYHDVGKGLNPQYFIENNAPDSINPHDLLAPEDSAKIILDHVTDGLKLAKKHRLPARLFDFIREHHGTTRTNYQYIKAVNAAGGGGEAVDVSKFTYIGPRPQSRETALVMIADGCEARARAERPTSEDAIRAMIRDTINKRLAEGQFNDTNLTLKDLRSIRESFTSTLKGIYHPRIEYPKLDKKPEKNLSPDTKPVGHEKSPSPTP